MPQKTNQQTNQNPEHLLLFGALVSCVVRGGAQVQGLAAGGAAAFPCGGGGGFCRLGDLDALGRDRFFLVFELEGVLPPISGHVVFLVVTKRQTRQSMYGESATVTKKLKASRFSSCCVSRVSYLYLIRSGESSRSFFRNLLSVSSMVLPILSLISPSFSLKGKAPLLLSQSSSHFVRSSSLAVAIKKENKHTHQYEIT